MSRDLGAQASWDPGALASLDPGPWRPGTQGPPKGTPPQKKKLIFNMALLGLFWGPMGPPFFLLNFWCLTRFFFSNFRELLHVFYIFAQKLFKQGSNIAPTVEDNDNHL